RVVGKCAASCGGYYFDHVGRISGTSSAIPSLRGAEMKEILEKILLYLPRFLSDCGSIIAGPKTFVLKKVETEALVESKEDFLFLALTVAVITIVSMLYPNHGEIYATLARNFVVIFVGFIGYSLAVRGAFWVAGGRAPYETFFAAYTYISCPMLLINNVIGLIAN